MGLNLVLLHPLPLDGSVWPPSLAGLADSVTTPTLYGYGNTLEGWARAVLDEVPSGPLLLVGNSVGGSCALEVAQLARERVRGVVLIGAKAGVRAEPVFRDEAVRLLREEGMAPAWTRYWAPLFSPDAEPPVIERARTIAERLEIEAIVNGVWAFHTRPDRESFLQRLDRPVMIVRGEHDVIPKNAESLASSLPRGRFVEVAGAGHYVPLEAPSELVAIVRSAVQFCA